MFQTFGPRWPPIARILPAFGFSAMLPRRTLLGDSIEPERCFRGFTMGQIAILPAARENGWAKKSMALLKAYPVIATLLFLNQVRGEMIAVPASADTTLFEPYPTNNLGGVVSTAAGTTARNKRTRALYRFDVAGYLPSNAVITSATLRLTVVRAPSGGGIGSTFGLYRLLRGWTEGNKTFGAIGSGASSGETTWLARQHPAELWSMPGAASPIDFVEEATATQFVDGYGPYEFLNVAADVRLWLAQPAGNFGWILIGGDEETGFTARRFGAREDVASGPSLVIEYMQPLPPAPRIGQPELVSNGFRFRFTAAATFTYEVERKTNLSSLAWIAVTNIPAS